MHNKLAKISGRVLVTGAAGSVGAALCAELVHQDCTALALLDHADHALLEATEAATQAAPNLEIAEVLCDVRDQERLTRAMSRFAPHTVIHCAALKHVHLGERHPGECVLTNLVGARNAMIAAHLAGAQRFVLISTDKAAAPVCVMGATKRLAELHLAGFKRETGTAMQLTSVRFGNVLASQGSVVPRFRAQIAEGGPLRVTHPEMKRFFMSPDEAVAFILDALALSAPGEVASYFREMGDEVSILRLGRDMIAASGKDIAVEFTGLRPGERLNEQLFDEFENVSATSAPGIYAVAPKGGAMLSADDVAQIEAVARRMDDAIVRQRVFAMLDSSLTRDLPLAG